MNALKQKMSEVGNYKSPEDVAVELKEQRNKAKQAAKDAAKHIKAFNRKCGRLSQKAKQLTDEGLLLEYARRQKVKAAREQAAE